MAIQEQPSNLITGYRRTEITQDIIDRLLEVISAGNYNIVACQVAGIAEPTFYAWLKRGEADILAGHENLYTQLIESLKCAQANQEAGIVGKLLSAVDGGEVTRRTVVHRKDGTEVETEEYSQPQWLGLMTFLERRHPDRWGRRESKQIDITEYKRIEVTHIEVIKDYGSSQAQIVEGELT